MAYKILVADNQIQLQLEGSIDEHFICPTEEVKAAIKGSVKLVIDWEKVSFVNSVAIANWLKFLRALYQHSPTLKVSYHNCPSLIIDEINWVRGFLPAGATVESFFAPVHCKRCEKSFNIKFASAQVKGKDSHQIISSIKTLDCKIFPECQKQLSLDVLEESFFKFLRG